MYEIRYLEYVGKTLAPRSVTYMTVPEINLEVFLHLRNTLARQGKRLWYLYDKDLQKSGPLIYCEPSVGAVSMVKRTGEPNHFLAVDLTQTLKTVFGYEYLALIRDGEIVGGYAHNRFYEKDYGSGKAYYARFLDTGHLSYAK